MISITIYFISDLFLFIFLFLKNMPRYNNNNNDGDINEYDACCVVTLVFLVQFAIFTTFNAYIDDVTEPWQVVGNVFIIVLAVLLMTLIIGRFWLTPEHEYISDLFVPLLIVIQLAVSVGIIVTIGDNKRTQSIVAWVLVVVFAMVIVSCTCSPPRLVLPDRQPHRHRHRRRYHPYNSSSPSSSTLSPSISYHPSNINFDSKTNSSLDRLI